MNKIIEELIEGKGDLPRIGMIKAKDDLKNYFQECVHVDYKTLLNFRSLLFKFNEDRNVKVRKDIEELFDDTIKKCYYIDKKTNYSDATELMEFIRLWRKLVYKNKLFIIKDFNVPLNVQRNCYFPSYQDPIFD